MRRVLVCLILCVIGGCGTELLAQTKQYPAFDHDLRIVLGLDVPKRSIRSFYDVYFGHNIRLGEFGCGDPRFLVHVNEVPLFSASGWVAPNGNYGTDVNLFSGVNAKIYERCFFLDQPSVGGTFNIRADLSRVSDVASIPLYGEFSISPLAQVLGITFPFEMSIPVPIQPSNSIPIKLPDQPVNNVDFDFVKYENGQWTSLGKEKDLPVSINAWSFGGNPKDNSYFVVDASIGDPRQKVFATPDDAAEYLASDLPVWSGSGNSGISVSDSLFGRAALSEQGFGLLGQLLPIRASGQSDYKILWWHRTAKWEVILDGASVELTQFNGQDAAKVSFTSSHACLIEARKRKSGDFCFPMVATATAIFDQLSTAGGALKFRVADFKVELRAKCILIPIRLSSGQLEQALNGGSIQLANINHSFKFGYPDCIDTGYEKFKADYFACGDPDQKIGTLSFEKWSPGRQSVTLYLNDLNPQLRRDKNRLQLSFFVSPWDLGLVRTSTTGSGPTPSASPIVFSEPAGVTKDTAGAILVSNTRGYKVVKALRTAGGNTVIEPLAGTGQDGFGGDGGQAILAQLSQPTSLAVDPAGNVYISDTGNNRIRKITGAIIQTVAGNGSAVDKGDGGPAIQAGILRPAGLAVDTSGTLYIADAGHGRIRVLRNGIIDKLQTVDSSGRFFAFVRPTGIALDGLGNLYVSDYATHQVFKVQIGSGKVDRVAGNGKADFSGDSGLALDAALNSPKGISIDQQGNLLIADSGNSRIRFIDLSTGRITTIAGGGLGEVDFGDNGPATDASLDSASAIEVDAAGNLYIVDTGHGRVRRVDAGSRKISSLSASGEPMRPRSGRTN